jgi:hypothetical protein
MAIYASKLKRSSLAVIARQEDTMVPKAPDAKQATEEIAERTQAAMGNYFVWLQNAVSASPWTNMELNKRFMGYATETLNAYVEHSQRLSQAKNFDDAVKIQTEFVQAQMEVFNQRAKELGEIYAKMAVGAASRPFGMST